MEEEVTFSFQLGLARGVVSAPRAELSLAALKELAVAFVNEKTPGHGVSGLRRRLMLFRHDYAAPNVLRMLDSAADVVDEATLEIVLIPAPRVMSAAPSECSEEETSASGVASGSASVRAHSLAVHSYRTPTFCDFCGEMLFGLVRQGLKCEGCGLNYHKRCAVKVPSNCAGGAPSRASSHASHDDSLIDLWGAGAGAGGGIPHTFEVHSYAVPTVCRVCRRLLRGLFKQGLQCRDCRYNAHRKCLPHVPKDCGIAAPLLHAPGDYLDSCSTGSEVSEGGGRGAGRDLRDDSDEEVAPQRYRRSRSAEELDEPQRDTPSSSSSSPSANIPLMRVVQSVKHTKRREGECLKEGWLVHFTNRDHTLRRHYWRLDSKAVTLFVAERGANYYREIPLTEVLAVDAARDRHSAEVMHCFEIRTANVDYLVGAESVGGVGGVGAVGGADERGVGAHVARSWETALRHALMPVTHAATEGRGGGGAGGAGGAAEMAQAYRIHPDEVLGSGQFGIVYGGEHRKDNRPVAIKVIDKLRFPTKQEAQLKNEVAILQNVAHPGVVNLERTFETPERIFVVMEKLRGDMLEMILSHDGGRLPERLTKFLVAQILVALKYLHEQNIVHCDLKPENVLLSSADTFPQVKLCDFGFARIIGEKSFRRSVVGTPAYLAPEVLRNRGYNRSLDMWSVGVIVYVALSGTFPFNEDEDIAEQIHNAAFMYPPTPWREISPEAVDLINKLLQVKQRKRLSVDKSLAHAWLQTRAAWRDLRALEARLGARYLTHESDDARWAQADD